MHTLTLTPTASSSLSLPPQNYIYSITTASPSSSFAAIASDDSLRVFDAAAGGDLSRVTVVASKSHKEGVTALQTYSAQEQVLVTGGRDGKARVWDLRGGKRIGGPVVEMETGQFSLYLFLW